MPTYGTHGRCAGLASHASPLAKELLEHVVCCVSEDTTELCSGRSRACGRCEERGVITD
jgi:hypothetical protein